VLKKALAGEALLLLLAEILIHSSGDLPGCLRNCAQGGFGDGRIANPDTRKETEMKKIFLLVLSLSLSSGFVLVCALAQKPKTYPTVPLIVSFRDAGAVNCDATIDPRCADRIRSDGNGAYTHGSQGVSAVIDQYGYLNINFQTTDTPVRQVYFDYSVPFLPPLDPAAAHTPPAPGLQPKAHLTTLPVGYLPRAVRQDLLRGRDMCRRRRLREMHELDAGAEGRLLRLRLHRGVDRHADSGAVQLHRQRPVLPALQAGAGEAVAPSGERLGLEGSFEAGLFR
jgi:hypothetical protein